MSLLERCPHFSGVLRERFNWKEKEGLTVKEFPQLAFLLTSRCLGNSCLRIPVTQCDVIECLLKQ